MQVEVVWHDDGADDADGLSHLSPAAAGTPRYEHSSDHVTLENQPASVVRLVIVNS